MIGMVKSSAFGPLPYRTYSGRIAYVGDGTAEAERVERGRETFTVTVQADGHRTIHARCEIDDAQVVRHVNYTVDTQWKPVEAYVRLDVKGSFLGSGWFRFTDTLAECETFMSAGGRVSQRIERGSQTGVAGGDEATSFGVHPVACDIWHLGGYDPGAVGESYVHRAFMSSLLPNGASGPMISTMEFTIVYEGVEELTVPAGTFSTHHYRYVFSDGHADEHIWYTTHDRILVRIRWDLLKTTYELVELTHNESN
jgi:hypothetical protein